MTHTVTREALLNSIDGSAAHMSFDELVDRFPPEHYNTRPPNVPYSFWALLEHVRICIDRMFELAFAQEARRFSWPRDYWPDLEANIEGAEWDNTVAGIRAGLAEMKRITADPEIDLTAPGRNVSGNELHTLVHQLIDIVDHNAYHFGEFAILRQVCGLWPADHQ